MGREAVSAGSPSGPARSIQPLSEDQRRALLPHGGVRGLRGGERLPGRAQGGEVLGGGYGLGPLVRGRRYGGPVLGGVRRGRGGGAAPGRLGQRGLGERGGEDRGDLGAGRGGRRAESGEVLGADGPGDPGAVQDPAFVGFGDEVLGLVVVPVGGLDGPEVDGDPVFLRGHQPGEQVPVAGDEHDVGAGSVAGQLGELGVHRGVHALLRPAAVAAGQGAEPDGDAGHDAQPPVFGLRHPVGGAVEPVDPQQRLFGVGLGPLAQALDEGGMVDGDAGA